MYKLGTAKHMFSKTINFQLRTKINEGVEDLTTLSVSAASSIPLMSSWSETEFMKVQIV